MGYGSHGPCHVSQQHAAPHTLEKNRELECLEQDLRHNDGVLDRLDQPGARRRPDRFTLDRIGRQRICRSECRGLRLRCRLRCRCCPCQTLAGCGKDERMVGRVAAGRPLGSRILRQCRRHVDQHHYWPRHYLFRRDPDHPAEAFRARLTPFANAGRGSVAGQSLHRKDFKPCPTTTIQRSWSSSTCWPKPAVTTAWRRWKAFTSTTSASWCSRHRAISHASRRRRCSTSSEVAATPASHRCRPRSASCTSRNKVTR